ETAKRRQPPRIGLGQGRRISDARSLAPEDAMAKHRRERGLKRERTFAVENLVRQAERKGELALGRSLREGLVAAIDLEPTSPAQITLRSRFRDQRLMLRSRTGKQRPHRLGKFDPALKRRIGTIGQKPWRDLRQETQVVVRLGAALEPDPQQRRKAAR